MTAHPSDAHGHPVHPVHPVHDLTQLARRFPDGFIERKDGIQYVAHHVVTQRLLSIVGPFDFELVEVIRGDVAAVAPDPAGKSRRAKAGTPALRNVVVGGVWRLTCQIDGRRVRIEEIGDVGDVHNWPHDGARLKDAASDALKRCAMRLGLGLHLWAQEHYFLDRQLRAILEQGGTAQAEAEAEAEEAAARQPRRPTETETEVDVDDRSAPSASVEGPAQDPAQGPAQAEAERGTAVGEAEQRVPARGSQPPTRAATRRRAATTRRPDRPQQEQKQEQKQEQEAAAAVQAGPSQPGDASPDAPPKEGEPGWRQPQRTLVRKFNALATQAGVDGDGMARYFRTRHGVDGPAALHGPALSDLVEHLRADGGLAKFKAFVDGLAGDGPARSVPAAPVGVGGGPT